MTGQSAALWGDFVDKSHCSNRVSAASIAAGAYGNMTTDNANPFLSTSKIWRLRENSIFQARRAKTAAVSSAVTYR